MYATEKDFDPSKPRSGVFRVSWDNPELAWKPSPNISNLQELWLESVRKFGPQPYLGTIAAEERTTFFCGAELVDTIRYSTYAEIDERARALGSAFGARGLAAVTEDKKISPICLYSRNREEWMVTDLACVLYGYTCVPLYDTLSLESIPYILGQTAVTTIVLGEPEVKRLLQVKDLAQVKNVVVMDAIAEATVRALKEKGLNVLLLHELVDTLRDSPAPLPQLEVDHPFTISYTSGTTGQPKGAVLTHRSMLTGVTAFRSVPGLEFSPRDSTFSYLPLPHIFERGVSYSILSTGGSSTFSTGDKDKVLAELKMVRPTLFVSVPRIFNRIYATVMAEVEAAEGFKKAIATSALESKERNLMEKSQFTSTFYDALMFSKVQDKLGGRVRYAITGSAPIESKVLSFLRIALACPVLEVYGQTESMGSFFLTSVKENGTGFVGGPNAGCEYKLVDIPEMDYTSQDILEGMRCPRGEICIRGPGLFRGYYKQPELTREALDQEGWLHTGDVGQLVAGNHALKIIDRKKNIFKLAQGEYVAPEKVENFYLTFPGIQEVWLHGDSLQAFCVAFFVCDNESVRRRAPDAKMSEQELRRDKEFRTRLLKEANEMARKQGKNSYELAKNCLVLDSSFGTKDLLTNTFKLMRHKARQVYARDIEALYAEGELK